MKIGWIGLGSIGNVMASNLIKEGYHLIVHDLEHKAAEKLITSGPKGNTVRLPIPPRR